MRMIEFKDISKSHGQGAKQVQVLQDINLNLKEGDFLVLLGFSGTGKPTLIDLMAGLDVRTGDARTG